MTTQTPQPVGTSGISDPTTGSGGGASVRDRAGHVGGAAKDQAADVAREAKYQARDLAGEARSQVRQQIDAQRGKLSDLLQDLSDELEQMAERSDRSGLASDLVRQAAMKTRDARSYLEGGPDVLEDVRRFARRRPGTFLIGAVAAGVFAGRAARAATAARRESQQRRDYAVPDYSTPRTTPADVTGTPASTYPPTSAYPPASAYPPPGPEYGATGTTGTTTTAPGTAAWGTETTTGTATGTPSAAPASGYAAAPEPAPTTEAAPGIVSPTSELPPDREEPR